MLSEFEIIARYFSPATTHTVLAGGDDAALVAVRPGTELVVSTDMLVGGRHFYEDAPAYGVGHKSLAVNLSDMAAMGAVPRWATLSLALPSADEAWLEAFARGFLDLARTYDVDLIGGDTARGPLNICVQIMGEAPAGKALRRSGARPGDDVWVSGVLGDAALALAHLRGEVQLRGGDLTASLQRLQQPQPRVALGQALIGRASSAIDVSDGLVADLGHIAERSGAKGAIEWMRVPVSAALARRRGEPLAQRCALAGGDDYELCFTADPALRTELDDLAGRVGLPLTRIGRMEAGQGVVVRDASGAPLDMSDGGFDHFR
jgi:thiamine-monophosphate kinase